MPFGADATFVEPSSLPQVAALPTATLVTSPSAARLLAFAFSPMPVLSTVPTAGRLAVAALAADDEWQEAALLDIARGD